MNVILEGTQLNQYYFGMKLIVMSWSFYGILDKNIGGKIIGK